MAYVQYFFTKMVAINFESQLKWISCTYPRYYKK